MIAKNIASIAATVLVAALAVTTAAEAGGCGRSGGMRFHQSRPSANYIAVQRAKQRARAQAIAAARRKEIAAQRALAAAQSQKQRTAIAAVATKPEVNTAEVVDVTKPEPVAETAGKVEPEVAVAATDTNCKLYIPTVETTVSVDCDKQ